MRGARWAAIALAIAILAWISWRVVIKPAATGDRGGAPASPANADRPASTPAGDFAGGATSTRAAIHPRRFDESDASPDAAEAAASRPVSVLVVNAKGEPQSGIPVAVIGPDLSLTVRGVTASSGIAQLSWPGPESRPAGRDPPDQGAAVIALPFEPPVGEKFEPKAIQREPIKLVMPPVCAVTVNLVKADGSAFEEASTVTLRPEFFDRGAWSEITALTAVPTRGRVRFPYVRLTGKFIVEVGPGDPALSTAEGAVEGPRDEGAEIALTLTCGGPALFVTGRLMTPDRVPVAYAGLGADLVARTQSRGDALINRGTATDESGRFQLRFDTDASCLLAAELHLEINERTHFVSNPPTPRAVIPLPATLRGGRVDLGDVVMARPAVVASGTVVDGEGHPVPGTNVWMMRPEKGGWTFSEDDVTAKCDPDGRFEIRARITESRPALIGVLLGWACPSPTRFERGASDVRVVMTRAGGIEGSIASLGGAWRTMFQGPISVVVAGPGIGRNAHFFGRQIGPVGLELEIAEGTAFSTCCLLPDSYTVSFVAAGTAEPLLVVENVLVAAGEPTRDPRLQNVDLRRFFKPRVVTVLDPNGKPIEQARVGARAGNDPSTDYTNFETGSDGRAVVIMPAGPVEIVVGGRGLYRSVVLPAVADDVTVTLKPAKSRTVTIRLAEGVAPAPLPFVFQAELRFLASQNQARPKTAVYGDPRNGWFDNDSVPLSRSAVLPVDEPGLYEVRLALTHRRPSYSATETLAQLGGNATVAVGEDGDATVTVTPDPADLKRLIERRKDQDR